MASLVIRLKDRNVINGFTIVSICGLVDFGRRPDRQQLAERETALDARQLGEVQVQTFAAGRHLPVTH